MTTYKNLGLEYTRKLDGTPLYTPKVIVLSSPETFSAAFHFLYFLTEIGHAKVVGTPSRQAGNSFMETTTFELPNTKIKGSISNSVQIMFPNDVQREKIFMPDYPMTWKDFSFYNFDKNAEILYCIDLIKQDKMN